MHIELAAEQDREFWTQFVHERSDEDRRTLIASYSPYANIIAAKLYANRQTDEIEFEEFRQYALVGLIEAIDKYNPEYDASFKTYAGYRIKGAVLDGIEKYCERQQQISTRARLREERMENLLHEAAESQLDPFTRLIDVAIGVAIGYMLEDSGMFQLETGVYEHNVYKSHELNDLVRVMQGIVETLPNQEKVVIKNHYFQQVRFDQIAEQLHLSKARVSQIHHSALRRMHLHYDQLKLIRTDY